MDSFDQAWELICQYCKTHISEVAYNTWLERLKPASLDFERGVAIIEAPNKFHMSTVHSFYSKLLQDAFDNVFGRGRLVPDLPARRGAPARPQPVREEEEDYELNFDTFVVGPSNRFCPRGLPGGGGQAGAAVQPVVHLRQLGPGKDPPAQRRGQGVS